MFQTLINYIGVAISAVAVWFETLATSMGFIATFIACFTIYSMVRLLIKPLVGGSLGSDSVKKHKKKD